MKITESQAKELLKSVGFNAKVVDAMSVSRLKDKVNKLPEITSIKKPKGPVGKLFDQVMSTLDDDEVVAVVTGKVGEKKPVPVAAGKKGGKSPSKKPADDEEDEDDDEADEEESDEEDEDDEVEDDDADVTDGDEEDEDSDDTEDGDDDDADEDADADDEDDEEVGGAEYLPVGTTVKFTYKKKEWEGVIESVDEENDLYAVQCPGRSNPFFVGIDDDTLEVVKKKSGKKPAPAAAKAGKGGKKPKVEDEDDDEFEDSELESDEDDESDDEDESEESEDEDDEDETTEDEEDEEVTTTKKPGKSGKSEKKGGKGGAFQSAAPPGKPGVIDSMVEFMGAASEQKPITKSEIIAKLLKRFKDKQESAVKSTVNTYIPTGLMNKRGIKVSKNANGYYIKKKDMPK